ncbi:MAG: GTPase domain-containing protein [Thermodesulfobacteriota bacterium]
MTHDISRPGFEKGHRKPLPALAAVFARLEELAPAHETEGGPLTTRTERLVRVCARLEDRLRLGPRAPLVVAVLGATGTGKSKIFNSLAGKPVSPSGFKRPTTLAPVLLSPAAEFEEIQRSGFLSGYPIRTAGPGPVAFPEGPVREVVLVPVPNPSFAGALLVDTPDFDSVLAENRAAAGEVFERAEALIFVTDAIKYADQTSWDYLARVKERNKEAVIVLNRLRNPVSLEDLRKRLAGFGLPLPVLGLPEEAGLGDEDLIPKDHPVLVELAGCLADWAGPRRIDLLVREASADWSELETGLQDGLLPGLEDATGQTGRLRQALEAAARQAAERLGEKLAVAISGELKNSLTAQIQALFLRWDVLRYPRRILALPFTLLKEKVLAPLGWASGSRRRRGLEAQVDRLFEANCQGLIETVQEYNLQAAGLFHSGGVGRGLAAREEFAGLALGAGEVRERYARVREDLEAWVEEQARILVQDLNLGEKMTFYLAQAVSLGLFISIQVHTGGGFSFFDGLLDSVLAPLLSKITGSALSREKVKAFEARASARHLAGCREIIARQAEAYLSFLAGAERGLAPAGPLREAVAELARAIGKLK